MKKQNFDSEVKVEEALLSRKQTAEFLHCNLVTLWRYTREGRIPYYRVGRRMFFKKSEILKAIKVEEEH